MSRSQSTPKLQLTQFIYYASMFGLLCSLMYFLVSSTAYALPKRMYGWTRIDSVTYLPATRKSLGLRADRLLPYEPELCIVARYTLAEEIMDVQIIRGTDALSAFGMFGAELMNEKFIGTIGNARWVAKAEIRFVYGPFYCIVQRHGGKIPLPPDAFVQTFIKKWLYRQADCYSTDFDLPVHERVLGSERFLAGEIAWKEAQLPIPEEVLKLLRMQRAVIARYRKQFINTVRHLIVIDFNTQNALQTSMSTLGSMLQRLAKQSEQCTGRSYLIGNERVLLSEHRGQVVIVVTDSDDVGVCEWLKGLFLPTSFDK